MNEIIKITTDEQGSSVVQSARELHGFLEVKSKFADWFKNRVSKYGFVEGADYVTVSKNLESGGRELDYALTLDMAKELSMVERNEKGKQARQYFIEAEKALRKVIEAPALTTEQAMLRLISQQTQLLSENQQLIAQLRADVNQIMSTGHKIGKAVRPMGKQLSMPGLTKPRPSVGSSPLRQLIHTRIIEYCGYHDVPMQETYNYLYRRLFDVYSINVYRLTRIGAEGLLDALERYGHLDRMYSLVMAELTYSED